MACRNMPDLVLKLWTVEVALDVMSFHTSWIDVSKCFDFLLGLVVLAYVTASCFHHFMN
jgi:hypothetical protein